MKIYKRLRDLCCIFILREVKAIVSVQAVLQWNLTSNPAILQNLKGLHILFGGLAIYKNSIPIN